MGNVETITYRGIIFRRYPDAKRRADQVYYTPGSKHRKQGVKRLHQEIWQDIHGPIPEGHHIHHKDENPLNNDPGNLVCLPAFDHLSPHMRKRAPGKEHMDRIRPLADEWHTSEEGRRWHREHVANSLARIEPRQYICYRCGKSFTAMPTAKDDARRACSDACHSADRRASGVDDVDRVCIICGKSFRINRYRKTPTCSRECGGRRQSQTKRARTSGQG